MNVDIVHMALTINLGRHREQESGANHVRRLNPGVVVAVAKHWHFHQPGVGVTCSPEFLREN